MSAHNLLYELSRMEIDTAKEFRIGEPAVIAFGPTVPADATANIYAIGCIFMHTDGADGSALYVNEGTLASADFNLITVAAA